MGFKLSSLFGGASSKPVVKTGAVTAAQTGTVYTITPQLDPSATLSLTSATNSNLTLSGSTISVAAALGAGVSQIAYVRETLGSGSSFVAEEYAVTIASPATVAAAPTLGSPMVSSGQISIPFTDGATGGSPITSHNVYRGTASGGETLLGNLTGASPFVDTGLTNGTAYYYKFSAVNGVGEGPLSSEVSATPTAIPGANPTAPSIAPSIQYHPNTSAITMRANSTFQGYITTTSQPGCSLLVVTTWSAANSQTIKGGMVLIGGGAAAGSTVCHSSGGTTGNYLITGAGQTVGSSASPVTFTAQSTQVVAMSDLKGNANLSSSDNSNAPELIVDDYGRRALLFAGESAAYGWLRNLTVTGIDTHNVAFFVVGRSMNSGKTTAQYSGQLVTLGAYEAGAVPSNAAILGAGSFPQCSSMPFSGVTTSAPVATAKRLFLGSQMQVLGCSASTTDGYGGTTTTVQARMWVNETSYSPATQTPTRATGVTGLTLNAVSKNSGANGGCPFIVYEINGYILGELGLTSQSQARGDSIVSAMMSNWGIVPIARSLVLLGDSRQEYGGASVNGGSPNESTGITVSSLISAPGPNAIPADVRVISWSAAGEGVGYATGYVDQGANNNTQFAPTPLSASWMLGGGKDYFTLFSGVNEAGLWPSTDGNSRGGTASTITNAFVDDYYNGPGYTTTLNATVSASGSSATATNISPAYIYPGMVFAGTGWSAGAFSQTYYAAASATIALNVQNTAAVSNANTTTGTLSTYQGLMSKLLSRGFKGLWMAEWTHNLPYFNSKVVNNAINDAQAGSGQSYAGKLLIGNPSLISVGGKFPFAADYVNNSYYLFDSVHMNTNGKRLFVYGGDTPQYGYRSYVNQLVAM